MSSSRAMSLHLPHCLLLLTPACVTAQVAYPTKPARIIASQSAGGRVDAVARLVAARLSEAFGQQVIVVVGGSSLGYAAADVGDSVRAPRTVAQAIRDVLFFGSLKAQVPLK